MAPVINKITGHYDYDSENHLAYIPIKKSTLGLKPRVRTLGLKPRVLGRGVKPRRLQYNGRALLANPQADPIHPLRR